MVNDTWLYNWAVLDGRLEDRGDPVLAERSPEYRQGWVAFGNRLKHHDNPYDAGRDPDRYCDWRQGFWDAEDDYEDYYIAIEMESSEEEDEFYDDYDYGYGYYDLD